MKALIVWLLFAATSGNGSLDKPFCQNHPVPLSAVLQDDEKQPVREANLPAGIKRTLASDQFSGWKVTEAFVLRPETASTGGPTGPETKTYEIVLQKDEQTRTIRVDADGNVLSSTGGHP